MPQLSNLKIFLFICLLVSLTAVSCTADNPATPTPDTAPTETAVSPSTNAGGDITAVIDPLIALNATVSYTENEVAENEFDKLFGEVVTSQYFLDLNGEFVTATYFDNPADLETVVEGIAQNSSSISITRPDGKAAYLINGNNGYARYWLHEGFLVGYSGFVDTAVDPLIAAFGESVPVWHEPTYEGNPVEMRIYNNSNEVFDVVRMAWDNPDGPLEYTNIQPGEFSDYLPSPIAYRYGFIELESNGNLSQFLPIDYVGETPLPAGQHTYVLEPMGDQISIISLRDDQPSFDAELVDFPLHWVAGLLDGGDDLLPPAVETPAHILFESEPAENGFRFNGFGGCNRFEGTYRSNSDGQLVVLGHINREELGCDGEAAGKEDIFMDILANVTYYRLQDNFLILQTYDGQKLTFTVGRPSSQPPYESDSFAGLGLLMQRLNYVDDVRLSGETAVSNATTYDLAMFGETIQALVFATEAERAAYAQTVSVAKWEYGRYLLTYSGDYSLINDELDQTIGTQAVSQSTPVVVEPTPNANPSVVGQPIPEPRQTIDAPVSLIFENNAQAYWRVGIDGTPERVIPAQVGMVFNPSQTHSAHIPLETSTPQLIITNLQDQSETVVEPDILGFASPFELQWLNDQTIVVGIFDTADDGGPNSGHLSLVDINTGELTILDSENKMVTAPAVSNGRILYSITTPAPIIMQWADGELTELDSTPFINAGVAEFDSSLFSPAVASDGKQAWWGKAGVNGSSLLVHNPADGSVSNLISIAGPPIGGFPSAVKWNSAGSWFAFTAWANDPAQAGIWIMSANGEQQIQLGTETRNPLWLGAGLLAYTANADSNNPTIHVYDLGNNITYELADLGVGAQIPVHIAQQIALPTEEGAVQPLVLVGETAVYSHPTYPIGITYDTADEFITVFDPTGTANTLRFTLDDGAYRLLINFRQAGESTPIGPCCTGAGEFVAEARESGVYLGQIPLYYNNLIYQDKRKMVMYTDQDGNGRIPFGNLEVAITLDATTSDYDTTDIPTSVLIKANRLLNNLWLATSTFAPEINPPTPDMNEVWSLGTYTSPDEQWAVESYSFNPIEADLEAEPYFYGQKHLQLFTISNDQATWQLIEEFEGWGLGVGQYKPLGWTDEAMYFTYAPVPDGCGVSVNSSDLWRYTFATHEVEMIMPSRIYISDISPDGTQLAGLGVEGIQVFDIETQLSRRYSLGLADENMRLHWINWHPDGDQLLVMMNNDPCGFADSSYVVLLADVANGTVQELFTGDGGGIYLKSWEGKTAVFGQAGIDTERIVELP